MTRHSKLYFKKGLNDPYDHNGVVIHLEQTSRSVKASGSSVQFSSFSQLCLILCEPMNRSTPGLPVHYQLLEFTQTHVRHVGLRKYYYDQR